MKILPTDKDLFTFLGGSRPADHPASGGAGVPPTVTDMTSTVTEKPDSGRAAVSSTQHEESQSVPPGLVTEVASPPSLSSSELSMIFKTMQTYVKDLPKLEAGDAGTRATRLLSWTVSIQQALRPVGLALRTWWRLSLIHI